MAAVVAVPAVVRAVAAVLAMTVVEAVATMAAPVTKEVLCKATSKSLIHQKQQSNRPF